MTRTAPSVFSFPNAASGPVPRVLVADDDAMIRGLIRDMLQTSGFEAVCVKDGDTAVDALREDPDGYVVALVDVLMPGSDGSRVLEYVEEAGLDIPVVLTSGAIQATEELQRAHPGAGVLFKPFSFRALIDVVSSGGRCVA